MVFDCMQLVGHLATIFVLCPTLEPIYGKAELSKTILVAILISNMLTVVCIYFIYAVLVGTGSDLAADILFRPIRGFYAGTAALLVALKQAIPDSEVTLLRVYHCRASDLAGIYILLIFVIGIITNTTLRLLPLAAFGTLGAWFYLRYFCCRPNSGIKGDPSDAFKFSTFLPTAVRPFADSLGSFLARAVKLDAPTEGSGSTSDMESVTSRLLNMETSSKHDIEAARRRERGIRALDETMAGQGAQKHEEEESAAKSTNIADGAVPAGNSEESA